MEEQILAAVEDLFDAVADANRFFYVNPSIARTHALDLATLPLDPDSHSACYFLIPDDELIFEDTTHQQGSVFHFEILAAKGFSPTTEKPFETLDATDELRQQVQFKLTQDVKRVILADVTLGVPGVENTMVTTISYGADLTYVEKWAMVWFRVTVKFSENYR